MGLRGCVQDELADLGVEALEAGITGFAMDELVVAVAVAFERSRARFEGQTVWERAIEGWDRWITGLGGLLAQR